MRVGVGVYLESLCVLCFVVENERSDDDKKGRFFQNKFFKKRIYE